MDMRRLLIAWEGDVIGTGAFLVRVVSEMLVYVGVESLWTVVRGLGDEQE